MVKYCPRCGYPNNDEFLYCPICGYPLATFPQQNTSTTMKFDNSSSQTVNFSSLIQCPRCGTLNVPHANFCKKCGFPLKQPQQAQSQSLQQPTISYQPPQQTLPKVPSPPLPVNTQDPASYQESVKTTKNRRKKVVKAIIADVAVVAIALILLSVVLPYFFGIILLPPLYIPPPAISVHNLTNFQLDSVLGVSGWSIIMNTSNLSTIYYYVIGHHTSSVQGVIAGSLVEYSNSEVNVYSIYLNASTNQAAQNIVAYITSNGLYYSSPNTLKYTTLVNGYTVYIAKGGNLLVGVTAFGNWVVMVLIYSSPSIMLSYSNSQLSSLIADMEVTKTL